MSKFSYLFGTALSFFRIGPNAGIKNNAGTIEIRDAIDSTFVAVKASIVQATGNAIELNANAAATGADHKYSIARPGTGMAAAVVLTLPPNVGTAGQILQTDGSGNLSYATLNGTAVPNGIAAPIAGASVNPAGVSVVDFSIPAGVRRLTLLSNGLITNNAIVRLGTSAGVLTTGYGDMIHYFGPNVIGPGGLITNGISVPYCSFALDAIFCMTFYRGSANSWNSTGQGRDASDYGSITIGHILLPGELTTFRYINTTTMTAGSLQLLWEF